jgi:N-terminal domain of galactosyltransferase
MTQLMPSDVEKLATSVADCVSLIGEPYAREAAPAYWLLGHGFIEQVGIAIARTECSSQAHALLAAPASRRRYDDLRDAVVDLAVRDRASIEPVFAAAWSAQYECRLGYHLGRRVPEGPTGDTEIHLERLLATEPAPGSGPTGGAEALVVIPFGDNPPGHRVRNIVACLLAVLDQSVSRDRFAITVLEAAYRPRWAEPLSRLADHYLHAPAQPNPARDSFAKAWAVNAAVVNTPGTYDVICVLDADVLVDRDFVRRNIERFNEPAVGAVLPYRDALYLDPAATERAVAQRVDDRLPTVDPDVTRGILARRTPGGCMWVRSSVFRRIGGFDERYVKWGGEDNDFLYRVDLETPVDTYRDPLLHMYHPSSSTFAAGGGDQAYAETLLTWRLPGPIGQLERPVDAVDIPA